MTTLSRLSIVVASTLTLSACGGKRPVAPAQPSLATCDELADHVGALAVADADDDDEAELRRSEAQKMKAGCGLNNRLADFAPVVRCLMDSETMDGLMVCQQLDENDAFSTYMGQIMDLAASTEVEVPTCSAFSDSLARLRHLELDDVSGLEGDELAAAHADIDASMPAFERACTANDQLSTYANIAQCLDSADSETSVERCTSDPMAHEFEDWLQLLIQVAESSE